MYTGSNIVRDGLIFGYDADDRSKRFYPGEPTVNLLSQPLFFETDILRNLGLVKLKIIQLLLQMVQKPQLELIKLVVIFINVIDFEIFLQA